MKRVLFIIVIFLCFPFDVFALDINSKNAILYKLDDNKILYSKNAYERTSIASLTKIMTAIVAIENIDDLDQMVVITSEDLKGLVEVNASVAGFRLGDRLTYRDLLYGLLLPSGADAANALARNISGSTDKFVQLMNKKAKELGLRNTHFVNVTGLDSPNHYSTVFDVAAMFKYALSNDLFKSIVTTKTYKTTNGIKLNSTLFSISNRYKVPLNYVEGGKTGTTIDAGLCLASVAVIDGVSYMLVTTGGFYNGVYSPINLYDAKTVYDYYKDNYGNKKLVAKGEPLITLPTKNLKEKEIEFLAKDDILYYLPNDYKESDIRYTYEGKNIVSKSISKNEVVGTLNVLYQNKRVATIDIVLDVDTHIDFGAYLYDNLIYIVLAIIAILVSINSKKYA